MSLSQLSNKDSITNENHDAENKRQQYLAYFMVFLICISTAGLTEFTEITESHFNYPFIIRYLCMTSIPLFLSVPLSIFKSCNPSTIIIKKDKNLHFYFWAFLGTLSMTSGGMVFFFSLDGVSVPTATALGGTRAVLVLILCVLLLKEELTLWKILAVIVSIFGVLCYFYESSNNTNSSASRSGNGVHDTMWGATLCLTGNLLFSINDIIARKLNEFYSNPIMGAIYYGFWQGIYQLPIFFWVFWLPKSVKSSDWSHIFWFVLPAISLMINNICVFIGVTVKSPFYVNIGTLLGIPTAFVADIFVHHYKPTIIAIIGAILLIISFLMLEIIKPPKVLNFCQKILINDENELNKELIDENNKNIIVND